MDIESTRESVYRFIRDEMNHGEEFPLETDLIQQGLIDSMGVMKLIGFLETTFGIQIELDRVSAEHFQSVGAVADLVASCEKGETA